MALEVITFPQAASDSDIRQAVVAWSELLAQERYADALAMFPHAAGSEWTPARLEDWISNYGCARADYDSGEYLKVTPLFEQPDPDNYVLEAIEVDRESLYGLDPAHYVGMVHYGGVPLDGEPSDLTARFHIKRVGVEYITLEFLDIHVM